MKEQEGFFELVAWPWLQGAILALLIFSVAGCGKNSTVTTPKPTSITTVTKTVKTTELKPVLAPQTTVQTQTQTFGPDGKPLPPDAALHKAEVKVEVVK